MYAFNATNHAGLRLRWYFDLLEQAVRAYAFATRRDHANPSPLASGESLPEGDMVSDAGEFARWLTGHEDDDALAIREIF